MKGPVTIRSFHAVSDPETSKMFYEGHLDVLRSYGVEPISSAKLEWTLNPAVYGVIAQIEDEVVGGVKIHKVGGTQPLPVEEAVGYMDRRLYDLVAEKSENGAGEACALWNARSVAGWGISKWLMCSIVALTEQLDIKYLFGLSSDHTLDLFQKLGYRVVKNLGKNGDFIYPTEEYLARVILMNSKTLRGAAPYNRETIFALRTQPNQKRLETGKNGELEVEFNIRLPVYAD